MKEAYTYTVLRYIPDVGIGEFINVGVALVSPGHQSVLGKFTKSSCRAKLLFPDVHGDGFLSMMDCMESGFETLGERFKRQVEEKSGSALNVAYLILPKDDSSLQWSPEGGGLTENPAETLEKLYSRFVREDSILVHNDSPTPLPWVDVRKRLPEKRQGDEGLSVTVPVTDGSSVNVDMYTYSIKTWFTFGNAITHWLDLGELPQREKEPSP